MGLKRQEEIVDCRELHACCDRQRTGRAFCILSGRRLVLAAMAAAVTLLIAGPRASAGQAAQSNPQLMPQATVPLVEPPTQGQTGPPLTISLKDAIQRAQQNSPAFQTAVTNYEVAREARVQATAAQLPSVEETSQLLNTTGNGLPTGRFVTNDGVQVYRLWGVVRENMPGSFFLWAGPRSAAYGEAIARANQEIARRGLVVTVTNDYYFLLVTQRAYATAQMSLTDDQRFLKIGQALEQGGEVAHTDVIRLQLQVSQAQQALADANLAMENARLNLAVLLFPTLNQNFTVVDDLDMPPVLPTFDEVRTAARTNNPEIRAAEAALRQADLSVGVARAAYLPSFTAEVDYGIEANTVALYSNPAGFPHDHVPMLGYFGTYTMWLPVWDWGARRSALRSAKDQRALAHLNLSFAQRSLLSRLYSLYNAANVNWSKLGNLQNSMRLGERNLQLVRMQYKAGQVTVLNVVDAETAAVQARDAYATGEATYRAALADLQTLTGSF
ncbi:MAG: TolC family protein [Terriglobia bacterium]